MLLQPFQPYYLLLSIIWTAPLIVTLECIKFLYDMIVQLLHIFLNSCANSFLRFPNERVSRWKKYCAATGYRRTLTSDSIHKNWNNYVNKQWNRIQLLACNEEIALRIDLLLAKQKSD